MARMLLSALVVGLVGPAGFASVQAPAALPAGPVAPFVQSAGGGKPAADAEQFVGKGKAKKKAEGKKKAKGKKKGKKADKAKKPAKGKKKATK